MCLRGYQYTLLLIGISKRLGFCYFRIPAELVSSVGGFRRASLMRKLLGLRASAHATHLLSRYIQVWIARSQPVLGHRKPLHTCLLIIRSMIY